MSQDSSDSVAMNDVRVAEVCELTSDLSLSVDKKHQKSSDEVKQENICEIYKRDRRQTEAKDVCEEKCSEHPDRVVEFICQKDDQMCCYVCMTTNHLNCPKIDYIPDITGGLEDADEYLELKDALNRISESLNQNRARYHTNLQRKAYMKEQATAALKTQKDNMKKMHELFYKEMESKITSMDDYNDKLLKLTSSRQESLTNQLQSLTTDLQHYQSTGQRCKLFIAMKKARSDFATLLDEVMKIEINNDLASYTFQPSDDLADIMERIQTAGKIQPVVSSKKKEEMERKEINIKSANDKVSCTISGMCLLPDDRLVLADVRNEALKVINVKEGRILSYKSMSSKPWDVTSLDEYNVALTLPKEKKIMFLSLDKDSTITPVRDIPVSGSCRGISYRKDQLVVSFDKPESKVQIFDSEGQLKSTITRDTSGNPLFHMPWNLTLNHDGFTIYVSDISTNSITNLTLNGKVMAIYRNKGLKQPAGITVDEASAVFVVGSSIYLSTIHQLTENLGCVQVFEDINQGMACPRSLAYDSKEQKMYVGLESSEKLLVISMK